MANTAFEHSPTITIPGSGNTTDNAVVLWNGTTGNNFSNSVVIINAGAVTGVTSLQVDSLNMNGNTISSTAGTDLFITPLAGEQIVLDGTIIIDAGVVTGATSITSTEFYGGGGNLTGIAAGPSQASATETLNKSNVDKYVPPDLLHNHPGVVKARWNGHMNVTPMQEHVEFGISGYTDNGVGDLSLAFDTDFTNVNYSFFGTGGHTHGSPLGITIQQYDTDSVARAVGSIRIWITYDYHWSASELGATKVDCDELDLIFFGDH